MENKIEICLGEYKIVAEIYGEKEPGFPPEMTVYVQNKDNRITQDICLVRPHYGYERESDEIKTDNGLVDCLVWADDYNEDYTHKFVIPVREEEEE